MYEYRFQVKSDITNSFWTVAGFYTKEDAKKKQAEYEGAQETRVVKVIMDADYEITSEEVV